MSDLDSDDDADIYGYTAEALQGIKAAEQLPLQQADGDAAAKNEPRTDDHIRSTKLDHHKSEQRKQLEELRAQLIAKRHLSKHSSPLEVSPHLADSQQPPSKTNSETAVHADAFGQGTEVKLNVSQEPLSVSHMTVAQPNSLDNLLAEGQAMADSYDSIKSMRHDPNAEPSPRENGSMHETATSPQSRSTSGANGKLRYPNKLSYEGSQAHQIISEQSSLQGKRITRPQTATAQGSSLAAHSNDAHLSHIIPLVARSESEHVKSNEVATRHQVQPRLYDEMEQWLQMTGYYNKSFRDLRLKTYRMRTALEQKQKALDAEKAELDRLLALEADDGLMLGTRSAVSSAAPVEEVTTTAQMNVNVTGDRTRSPISSTRFQTMAPSSMLARSPLPPTKIASIEGKRPRSNSSESRPRPPGKQARLDGRDVIQQHDHYETNHATSRDYHRPIDRYEVQAQGWLGKERIRNGRYDHALPYSDDELGRNADQPPGPLRHNNGIGRRPSSPDMKLEGPSYFMIKSWNLQDVENAQRDNTWATPVRNAQLLTDAFHNSTEVILFFSANHSAAFQGAAVMIGTPDPSLPLPAACQHNKWKFSPAFPLRWIYKIPIATRSVAFIKNPLVRDDDGYARPIGVGRDGQQIPADAGKKLLQIFKQAHERNA